MTELAVASPVFARTTGLSPTVTMLPSVAITMLSPEAMIVVVFVFVLVLVVLAVPPVCAGLELWGWWFWLATPGGVGRLIPTGVWALLRAGCATWGTGGREFAERSVEAFGPTVITIGGVRGAVEGDVVVGTTRGVVTNGVAGAPAGPPTSTVEASGSALDHSTSFDASRSMWTAQPIKIAPSTDAPKITRLVRCTALSFRSTTIETSHVDGQSTTSERGVRMRKLAIW